MCSEELSLLRSLVQGCIVVLAMCCLHSEVEVDDRDDINESVKDVESSHKGMDKATLLAPEVKKKRILLIQQPFGPKEVFWIVFWRGLIGATGLLLYFYTISALPLGDAVSALSLSPILTVIGAGIFLENEPVTMPVVVAAMASIVGSILIAKPSFFFSSRNTEGVINGLGYVTGLIGSCTSATVFVLIRKAGTALGGSGVHTLQLLFSWCLFGSAYGVTLMLFLPSNDPSDNSWFVLPSSTVAIIYIICMLGLGIFGHFCMNYGGKNAPAGLTAIVRSSIILWGYMFEILVFGQIPDGYTIAGALLILASLGVISREKKSNSSNKSKDLTSSEEKLQPELQSDMLQIESRSQTS